MKKLFMLLTLTFLMLNVSTSLSQVIDCGIIDCPDGYTAMSTGWVLIPISDGPPPTFCVVKICYCYKAPGTEDAQFIIKKILWADPDCYPPSLNIQILKNSLMTELIKQHQNEMLKFCNDQTNPSGWTASLTTSLCYFDYIPFGSTGAVSMPCGNEGYCEQIYRYCWDNTVSPWQLVTWPVGPAIPYGYCETPLIPPGQILNECQPWCQ